MNSLTSKLLEDSKKLDYSSSDNDSKVDEEKIPEPMIRHEDSKTNVIVLMKAQTWNRDSHGLYDYESKSFSKLEKKVETDGYLIRNKDSVSFHQKIDPSLEEDETLLFHLKRKTTSDGKIESYFVSPQNDNDANDRLWHVVRSLKEGHQIKKHDILKLGRMKFKVKEFVTENEYFEGEQFEKSPHQGFEELLEVEQSTTNDIP